MRPRKPTLADETRRAIDSINAGRGVAELTAQLYLAFPDDNVELTSVRTQLNPSKGVFELRLTWDIHCPALSNVVLHVRRNDSGWYVEESEDGQITDRAAIGSTLADLLGAMAHPKWSPPFSAPSSRGLHLNTDASNTASGSLQLRVDEVQGGPGLGGAQSTSTSTAALAATSST